jgi:hypothetical protein
MAVTINDKEMPVDAEPSEKGNLVLFSRGEQKPLVLSLTNLNDKARDAAKRHGVPLYVSHFFTCPQADAWRR